MQDPQLPPRPARARGVLPREGTGDVTAHQQIHNGPGSIIIDERKN